MDLDSLLPAAPPTHPARGMLAVICGAPGVGKTSWAAQWPSPEAIIDFRDQGTIDLVDEGLIPLKMENIHVAESYGRYVNNLQAAIDGPCKTIICESITGIQALCHDECSKNDHDGDMSPKSFQNFQAGPIAAADRYFQKILDKMLAAQGRGKHVILVGHTKPTTKKNILGDDFMGTVLGCTNQMALRIEATFTNIFVVVSIPTTTKPSSRAVAKVTGHSKWLYAQETPTLPSKNRMGIKCEFEFGDSGPESFALFCKNTNRNPKTGYRFK